MKPERAKRLVDLLNQTDPHLTYPEVAKAIGMSPDSVNAYAGLLIGLGLVTPRLRRDVLGSKPMTQKQRARFDDIQRLRATGLSWRGIDRALGIKGASQFIQRHTTD